MSIGQARPPPAEYGSTRSSCGEAQRQVRERADHAAVRGVEAAVLEADEVQRALERRRVPVGERDQDRAVGRAGVLRVRPHAPRPAAVLEAGRRAAHERPRPGPVAPVGGRREVRRPARAAHEQVEPVTRHHRVRIRVAEPASGAERDRTRRLPSRRPRPTAARHAVAHPAAAVARVEVAAVRRGERVQALAEEHEAGVVVVVGLERLEQRPQPAATRLEVEVLDHGPAVGADAAGEDVALVRHRARIAEVRPRARRHRARRAGRRPPVQPAGTTKASARRRRAPGHDTSDSRWVGRRSDEAAGGRARPEPSRAGVRQSAGAPRQSQTIALSLPVPGAPSGRLPR